MESFPGISIDDLRFIGEDLDRAECVLTTAAGEVFCSDRQFAVVQIGQRKQRLQSVPNGFLPNGFALLKSREFLVANLDPASGGGVWKMDRDRCVRPWLLRADGEDLAVANSVAIDTVDRIWVSVSTRQIPRARAYRAHGGDGFIVIVDTDGSRIVADGLGFTNESRVDPTGKWLYVNETFARRLSRFPIRGAALGSKEVICEFTNGDFPDGLAFDAEGGAWVTCIISNRVVRVRKDGSQDVILDASDQGIIDAAEARFKEGTMDWADIHSGARCKLGNVSSLAFGGSDLKQVYLGTLGNKELATFRSPIAGAKPPHWF
jgi:sugar lactone lactonase YvrE